MTSFIVILRAEWSGSFGLPRQEFRTLVEVDEVTTLASVILEGARGFGVSIDPRYLFNVAFFGAEATELWRLCYPHREGQLPGVDAQGRVFWCHFRDLSCGDLLRAGEAGLIEGVATEPELVPQVAAGGPDLGDWQALLHAFSALWQAANALGPVSNLYAVTDILMKIARRVRPAKDALDKHHADWGDRGGDPSDVFRLLSAKPWTAESAGRLLACSPAEAEALLWGWGFAYDEDTGVWSRSDDWEARIIRHVVDAILGNLVVEEKRATKIARAVFETYARTGDLPPLWPEQSERPDTGARES